MNKLITIQTTDGPKNVTAEVFGTWAVHKPWRGGGWAITHVATGMCVPPFYTKDLTKTTAVRCAKALEVRFPNPTIGDEAQGRLMAELIWKVLLGGKP